MIDTEFRIEGSAQGLQLRCKGDIAADLAVIKRLLSHSIADQPQFFFVAIPDADCKHSFDFFERFLNAPSADRLSQYFSVGMTSPSDRAIRDTIQFRTQRGKVVDFAVECDNVST